MRKHGRKPSPVCLWCRKAVSKPGQIVHSDIRSGCCLCTRVEKEMPGTGKVTTIKQLRKSNTGHRNAKLRALYAVRIETLARNSKPVSPNLAPTTTSNTRKASNNLAGTRPPKRPSSSLSGNIWSNTIDSSTDLLLSQSAPLPRPSHFNEEKYRDSHQLLDIEDDIEASNEESGVETSPWARHAVDQELIDSGWCTQAQLDALPPFTLPRQNIFSEAHPYQLTSQTRSAFQGPRYLYIALYEPHGGSDRYSWCLQIGPRPRSRFDEITEIGLEPTSTDRRGQTTAWKIVERTPDTCVMPGCVADRGARRFGGQPRCLTRCLFAELASDKAHEVVGFLQEAVGMPCHGSDHVFIKRLVESLLRRDKERFDTAISHGMAKSDANRQRCVAAVPRWTWDRIVQTITAWTDRVWATVLAQEQLGRLRPELMEMVVWNRGLIPTRDLLLEARSGSTAIGRVLPIHKVLDTRDNAATLPQRSVR